MVLLAQGTGCHLLLVWVSHHETRLGHGHGPGGRRRGSGGRVERHVIQRLIHRLPRVLPRGDFFYVIEEVPLASGREGHLPARGQRQLVGHVVGLLAEVRVLLRGAGRRARAGAQLQGRGRRVRADVLGAAGQPGSRVAPGRVGARLARVRAGVRLLEEGLGQDLLAPRAGLGVHDRVEEGFEVRVEVLRDVDHLLPGRRERRGRRGRIHLLGAQRSRVGACGGRVPPELAVGPGSLGRVRARRAGAAARLADPEPTRCQAAEGLRLSHPPARPRAFALRGKEAEEKQTARPPRLPTVP